MTLSSSMHLRNFTLYYYLGWAIIENTPAYIYFSNTMHFTPWNDMTVCHSFDVEWSKSESVFYSLVCHSFSIQKVFHVPDLVIHVHFVCRPEHLTFHITSYSSSKSASGESYFFINIFNSYFSKLFVQRSCRLKVGMWSVRLVLKEVSSAH